MANKRLMWGERVIGDYPHDWEPPEESDLHKGIADGSMTFVESPAEPVKEVGRPRTLVDQIVANPDELAKLKTALGL